MVYDIVQGWLRKNQHITQKEFSCNVEYFTKIQWKWYQSYYLRKCLHLGNLSVNLSAIIIAPTRLWKVFGKLEPKAKLYKSTYSQDNFDGLKTLEIYPHKKIHLTIHCNIMTNVQTKYLNHQSASTPTMGGHSHHIDGPYLACFPHSHWVDSG